MLRLACLDDVVAKSRRGSRLMSTESAKDVVSIAAAVRQACIQVAIDAYEDAAMRGLCQAGRWEVAVAAMRGLDLHSLKDLAEGFADRDKALPHW
jgi:hypothetical protein